MLSYRATLSAMPGPAVTIPADIAPPPIRTETDFRGFAAMARADWAPIHVNFPQKYGLLARILTAISRHLDPYFTEAIMTCRLPGMLKIPPEMATEKIFLTTEIGAERARLKALGRPFLTIVEGFVRFPLEIGRNELEIDFHSPGSGAACQAFAALTLDLDAILAGKPHDGATEAAR